MQAYEALYRRRTGGELVVRAWHRRRAGPPCSAVAGSPRAHGFARRPASSRELLGAGADVIRTNTFQLNRRTYLNAFRNAERTRHIGAPGLEHRAADLTRQAVELARAARDRSGRAEVQVVGVLSPLEHCFSPDLAPSAAQAQVEHE